MSIDAVAGESDESFAIMDDYLGPREKVSTAIQSVANIAIQLNSFFLERMQISILPLHPGEYGQSNYRMMEIFKRCITLSVSIPSWMATLPFATVGALSVTLSNLLIRPSSYRIRYGNPQAQPKPPVKCCLFNPRMLSGVSPLKMAGLEIGSKRYNELVTELKAQDPDILFMPEVNRFIASSLSKDLSAYYRFFFTGMGERAIGEDSSFFIAFRGTLIAPPKYVPFKSQSGLMERGYFLMETKDRVYLFTYCPSSKDWDEIPLSAFGGKPVMVLGEMESKDKVYLERAGFSSAIPQNKELTSDASFLHFHGKKKESPSSVVPFLYVKHLKKNSTLIPKHDSDQVSHSLSDHPLILHR